MVDTTGLGLDTELVLVDELDVDCTKLKHKLGKWLESCFSKWVLVTILDLCRLRDVPKVATLATKLNLF